MEHHEVLTATQVSETGGLADWRVLLRRLHASFRAPSASTAFELAARVGAAAEAADHHPDLHIGGGYVRVVLTTHDAGGVTTHDVDLARAISAIAGELGLVAEPDTLTELEVAIDALDIGSVQPFWEAVLGYRSDPRGDSVDPARRGPAFWFQQMDAPRAQRNRIHVDVTVAHDVAPRRIAAALAAGGTLVSDRAAPAFWVLADPEGNEACITTWQGRDG